MTHEAKTKKAFMDRCRKYGIVTFSQILKTENLRGVIVNLELFRIRGIPDKLVLMQGGKCLLFEFKAPKGVMSETQKLVMKTLHNLQISVDLVRGEADARFMADVIGAHNG